MSDNVIGFPHGFNGNGHSAPPQEVSAVEQPDTEAWQILQEAANLVEGERNEQHGAREKCHAEIAKLWTWWCGFRVDAHDVAIMMSLLKVARIKTGGYVRDAYLDGCGYLSIAGELRKGNADS